MFKIYLSLLTFILSWHITSAQILDSVRFKVRNTDTLVFVNQQDVNDYISLAKISDTAGKLASYLEIIKVAKEIYINIPKSNYQNILLFTDRNEKYKAVVKKPITAADINEYIAVRKITGDTTGKTKYYIKIIKSAKTRMAMADFNNGLFKVVDYETALKDAEENFRLRNLVNKILVVKHQRKMYLLKDGKAVKTFQVSLGPNPIGQKEYEGDGKTPEGTYTLDWQKWNSSTLHSFHISYPNKIDSARAKKKGLVPGSFIMVHGTSKGIKKKKDWTNGCIALKNEDMLEFKRIVFQDTVIEITK